MNILFLLVIILLLILSCSCIYTTYYNIKEGLSLPNCDNDATCKDGSSKCDTYLSKLKKGEKIPDKMKNKLDDLQDYVDKTYKIMKNLDKQSKNCK